MCGRVLFGRYWRVADCSPLNVNYACVTELRLRHQLGSPIPRTACAAVAAFVQNWREARPISVADIMPSTGLGDTPANRAAVETWLFD